MHFSGHKRPWLAATAALAGFFALATPAHAESDAQKLRRLDIMLMVTGLRCRTTEDNFMDDYGAFTSGHMKELNDAAGELTTQLSAIVGEDGAKKALDQMGVVMANEYGAGHPWLSCHELRSVTQGLASVEGRDTLVEVAGQILERKPPILFALARR